MEKPCVRRQSMSPVCHSLSKPRQHVAAFLLMATAVPGLAQTFNAGTDKLVPRYCTNSCIQSVEQIGIDDAGNGFALWTEAAIGSTGPITVSRYSGSTNTWSSALRPFGENGRHARIGVDAAGNTLAVWVADRGTDESGNRLTALRYSYNVPGQGWTRAATVAEVTGYNISNIVFTNARSGHAHVVYTLDGSTRNSAAFDPISRTWTTTYFPTSDGQTKLSVSTSGRAYAVTMASRWDGEGYYLYALQYNPSYGYWEASYLDQTGTEYEDGIPIRLSIDSLSIAADRFGNAMALWEKTRTKSDNIFIKAFNAVRYVPSQGYWRFTTLPGISTANISASALAADSNGNFFAVWNQYVGSYAKTVAARYRPSASSWTTPKVIQTGSSHSRDVNVIVDRNNNAYAAWSQRADTSTSSSGGTIFRTTIARFTASNNTWNLPLRVQDAYQTGFFPHLGVDSRARAIVMWTQNSGRFFFSGAPIKEIRSDRLTPY